jgi:2-enoate reductase
MDKQGIDVHLSREVDADLIAEEAPDAVVLATGGFPFVPGIPGIDRGNVVLATDVLTGKTAIGDKVVIIGGELVGCEVGDMLAETGKKVTITTLESDLLTFDVIYPARMSLLLRLRNNGVGMLTGVKYKEITDDGIVLVDKEGGEKTIKADNIVVAAGTRPNDRLVHLLKDKVAELYCVGDCVEPHNILNAMKAGYEAGLSI